MTNKEPVMGVTVGTLINERYEILSLLGVGGFAAVFQAHDSQIERNVAIKVLNVDTLVSQGNDLDTVLARFSREAKTAASINHPCVVQIYDFGVLKEQDNPFIIMEMLSGHDLQDELKAKKTLDPARFIPLFVDTLEALGEAHKVGIVHKDIKPSNLFLADPETRRETLKLVDFGIAHIAAQSNDERLTKTGYMLGTPQYMAPEYVEQQQVSPALDVYQMGLLLVEMLAGQPVIQETNPWKCALMHVSRELTVPIDLLESPLGPVLQKALALAPKDRYENGIEFADALADVDVSKVPHLSIDAESRTLDTTAAAPIDELSTQTLAAPPQRTSDPGSPATDELSPKSAPSSHNDQSIPQGIGFTPGFAKPKKSSILKDRPVVLLLVLIIFVGLSLAVILNLFQDDQTPDENLSAEIAVDIPPIDPLASHPSFDSELNEPEPEPEPEPQPEPEPIYVEVQTSPFEADITIGGESVGTGLFSLAFDDESTSPEEVSISHDGYLTKTEEIGPDTPSPVRIRLEREPRPTRQASAPNPPRERPTPSPAPVPTSEKEVESDEKDDTGDGDGDSTPAPTMQMAD